MVDRTTTVSRGPLDACRRCPPVRSSASLRVIRPTCADGCPRRAGRGAGVGPAPRVRSQANGSHYTSTDELPLVPGIDGVGRRSDGSLAYFILPDTAYGAMAERTVIDVRRSIPLPSGADPLLLAATMNPGMSSWVALQQRIDFQRGQSVLILGATGSAGQLAVQVAKHLGAGAVVAAGRGATRLAAMAGLGADDTIDLAADPEMVAHELAAKAANVDVVLDYLWGRPAESAVMPRADRTRRSCPADLLGADRSRRGGRHHASIGCAAPGQHSFPRQRTGFGQCRRHPRHTPGARRGDRQGGLRGRVVAKALADVESVWNDSGGATGRIVLQPSP